MQWLFLTEAQYVDSLILLETKLHSIFLSTQFQINGSSVPHRLERNSKGGGMLVHVRDKIIVFTTDQLLSSTAY